MAPFRAKEWELLELLYIQFLELETISRVVKAERVSENELDRSPCPGNVCLWDPDGGKPPH